ncbi:zinc finger protein 346 [Sorex fumeus]|uniref:zinc finger protein 346 n=1 Tax=Sorex fumeus TaxID=62283 RepID=UPI0024AC8C01|nr:zinc finger protein 346 [Sorex fumeus]
MQRPEPGPAQAGDGGGGGPAEAPGDPEPDGPRCDRERARCLREAASAALPVGKKEVENMIQKNQCLFTNTQCKVCCALLISESQKLAHYQSKKHANKVKRYLIIHGLETLKGDAKKLDSDQGPGGRDQSQCCPLCSATFSSPAVARSHYLGKTHAKNLKLKQPPAKGEALSKRLAVPSLGASHSQEAPAPDQFCSVCHAAFNDPAMAQQHYQGKKHRKQETKLRLMAHYGRLAGPISTGSLAGKGYPCKTCKIVLNSIEQYQAHISGFKHKNQSPKTATVPPSQSPTQEQPLEKDLATLEDQRLGPAPQVGGEESQVAETGGHLSAPAPFQPGAPGWAEASDRSCTPTPWSLRGKGAGKGSRGAGVTQDLAGPPRSTPWSPQAASAPSSQDPVAAPAELSPPSALGITGQAWGAHAEPGASTPSPGRTGQVAAAAK